MLLCSWVKPSGKIVNQTVRCGVCMIVVFSTATEVHKRLLMHNHCIVIKSISLTAIHILRSNSVLRRSLIIYYFKLYNVMVFMMVDLLAWQKSCIGKQKNNKLVLIMQYRNLFKLLLLITSSGYVILQVGFSLGGPSLCF